MANALHRLRNGRGENALLDGFLALADEWVARASGAGGSEWFRRRISDIVHASSDRALATAIGLAPRRLGKADLSLNADDKARAAALRPGFDPSDWSVDQVARVAFMVASHDGDDSAFAARLDSFCGSAELNELIALCRGLPLYPGASLVEPRAREAVRSGMKPVFEAVAHNNPYPGEVFSEDAWNHMVVKALFIGSLLWPIQGLDRRANAHLARMLVDFAQERWAAERPVSAELWRCVAPYADTAGVAALTRAWRNGEGKDRLAIALALQHPAGASITLPFRNEVGQFKTRLADEKIGWRDVA
jgi:hypothetical protein